jgi:hypothetical protein
MKPGDEWREVMQMWRSRELMVEKKNGGGSLVRHNGWRINYVTEVTKSHTILM